MTRDWFIQHFETIWNNRHKLKNKPYADIVIKEFIINSFGCPYYAYKIDKYLLPALS